MNAILNTLSNTIQSVVFSSILFLMIVKAIPDALVSVFCDENVENK